MVLLVFGRDFITSPSNIGGLGEGTSAGQSATESSRVDGKVRVTSKELDVLAEVADNRDERRKGLSKFDELPINEGMLFVFEESSKYTFWMKGVKFPIDIIWISELPTGEKKIVYIVQNAAVELDKDDNELTRYNPISEAKYVLEINAGLASLKNLQIGDQVNFEL